MPPKLTLLLLTFSIALSSSPGAARTPESREWVALPPLPDPVGFGGMFAGTSAGHLFAGGGSQFREKPVWLGGTKTFSDRIFALAPGAAKWIERSERLPEPASNFACAWADDSIFLVGGLTTDGSMARTWRLRERAGKLEIQPLPDLPQPLTQACAAVVGRRLYVAGGLRRPTDATALTDVWSLPIDGSATPAWKEEPSLPGRGVFVATAAAAEGDLYLLGGMEFDAAGNMIPSRSAHRFETATRVWHAIPDLPVARVGPASPSVVLRSDKILVVGGYAEIFPGPMREHPGFPVETLVYDMARRGWSPGPRLPATPVIDRDSPTDRGPCSTVLGASAVWNGLFVVVSGESRASTRTPAVIGWPLALEP